MLYSWCVSFLHSRLLLFQSLLWRRRHWNLLENKRTPLISAHVRQLPQNVLECRLPASRFTCWSGVSLIPLSLALLYTYVLVTVNTHSHSNQH